MSILKYLQSKKIIPSKEAIIKSEARKLAKRVSSPDYFITKMDNLDIAEFHNEFGSAVLNILLERERGLRAELETTEDAIQKLK